MKAINIIIITILIIFIIPSQIFAKEITPNYHYQYSGIERDSVMIGFERYHTEWRRQLINTTCFNGYYYYPCQQWVNRPVRIVDYRVLSIYDLNFDDSSSLALNKQFRFYFPFPNEIEDFYMIEQNRENLLALGKIISRTQREVRPLDFHRNIKVKLKFLENRNQIISPLTSIIEDLEIEDDILSFALGEVFELNFLKIKLTIEEITEHGHKTHFNNYVNNNQLELSPYGDNKTLLEINLIDFFESSPYGKRFVIKIAPTLDFDGYKIINQHLRNFPIKRKKTLTYHF